MRGSGRAATVAGIRYSANAELRSAGQPRAAVPTCFVGSWEHACHREAGGTPALRLAGGGIALGWGGDQWKGDGVDGRGIVAEAHVDRFANGAGNREAAVGEAIGDGRGRSEVGVGADGIKKEEFVADEGAGLVGGGAANFFEDRNADEIHKELPIALDAVETDGAEFERAEGGGAELA